MPIAVNPKDGSALYLDSGDGEWKPAQTAVNPETKETLAFDGKDWTPLPKPAKGAFRYLDDTVRSLANGMTFGFADELAAKGNELVGKGNYADNLAAEKARDAQIPGAIKYPGEVAGAIAGTVAAAPIAAPVATAAGVSRLPALARSVLGGSAGGAVFGAGEADPGNRTMGAAQGAGLGVAAGGVAYPLAKAGGAVVNGVRNAFNPPAQAAADLVRAAERDGIPLSEISKRYTQAAADFPGEATIADIGGENIKGLVERLANTPGAGRTTVVPFLTERQHGQAARLNLDLMGLTGNTKSAVTAVQDTMAARKEAADPLYKIAMDFNAREVPEIVQAFDRETGQGFGQEILRSKEFKNTLQTEYGIKDPKDAPMMVVIDAWKKAADDVAKGLKSSGYNNAARVVGDMRDRVISVVDQMNPAYPKAREAWAGPTKYLEAIESGKGITSPKISAEEIRQQLADMTASEREAYVTGALGSIFSRMGNDTAKMPDLTKYLRSPEMRAKVEALMPSEEVANAWRKRLDFEVNSSALTGRALGNSSTSRREAERDAADHLGMDLVMGAFGSHPPISMLGRFLNHTKSTIRDTVRSRSDQLLANALLNPDAVGSAELARVLSGAGQAPQISVARQAIPLADAATSQQR